VVASEAPSGPDVIILLCNASNGQGQGTTGPGTGATFVIEMFDNEGDSEIEFSVISGTVRFRILYQGGAVLDTGFVSGPDTQSFSFGPGIVGPGIATTVTLETTLGSPDSVGFFEVDCPFTA
jgi:hypothetical protein